MNTDKIFAESLAKEYAPKSYYKVKALEKLDRRAKMPAVIIAYCHGIIFSGIFIAGIYISILCMIGSLNKSSLLGILILLIGFVGIGINYPIHKLLLEKVKKRYAFEILQICEEICENN